MFEEHLNQEYQCIVNLWSAQLNKYFYKYSVITPLDNRVNLHGYINWSKIFEKIYVFTSLAGRLAIWNVREFIWDIEYRMIIWLGIVYHIM